MSKEGLKNRLKQRVQSKLGTPALEEKIRRRAYQIYVARGGAEGHAEDDWRRAELEVWEESGLNTKRPWS